MGKLRFHLSISLDGYAAGPDQSEDNPLGVGGEALHDWALELQAWRKSHGREGGAVNASSAIMEENLQNVGAGIMGRNMFGPPAGGPWDQEDPWNGWWGDDPPFHHPVFVLTHHEREPLTLGDTTFTFVTDGIESALEQARATAGDQDVQIHGSANTIQQYLAAGLVDEFELGVVPILLGGGERLIDNLGDADLKLEVIRVVDAPGVTHLKYAVSR
jgi:dihydrofolate reductase